MDRPNPITYQEIDFSEAAIDGLLRGVAGGVAMAVYLVLAGWLSGQGAAATLAQFDPAGLERPLVGGLTHLAVSGVYGLLFGWLWRLSGRYASRVVPVWVTGLLYGAGLWLLAVLVLLPGNGSPLLEIPHLHLALAHLAYGLTLGWLTRRG